MALNERVISGRVAERARLSMTRERLQRAIAGDIERAELSAEELADLRLIRQAIQADLDMDLDPAYKDALAALRERLGERRIYNILVRPEQVLPGEVTYPVTQEEAALLVGALLEGQTLKSPARWTLDRMAEDDLLPAVIYIGGGKLPRKGYFARDIVAAAYRTLFLDERPEVLKAELAIARRQLRHEAATYLKMLPEVDTQLVELAEAEPEPG